MGARGCIPTFSQITVFRSDLTDPLKNTDVVSAERVISIREDFKDPSFCWDGDTLGIEAPGNGVTITSSNGIIIKGMITQCGPASRIISRQQVRIAFALDIERDSGGVVRHFLLLCRGTVEDEREDDVDLHGEISRDASFLGELDGTVVDVTSDSLTRNLPGVTDMDIGRVLLVINYKTERRLKSIQRLRAAFTVVYGRQLVDEA